MSRYTMVTRGMPIKIARGKSLIGCFISSVTLLRLLLKQNQLVNLQILLIYTVCREIKQNTEQENSKSKNSNRDARIPQPGEIVFNTMRYRCSETVHRLGYFQRGASVQIMFKWRK